MVRLNPGRLHVRFSKNVRKEELILPRCYTLTHSDSTGKFFLTIAKIFDKKQVSGFLIHFMRDEALGEWKETGGKPELHVYCHVSGGMVLGTARWRNDILVHEMPLVLEIIRHGDRRLFQKRPELGSSRVKVHFISSRKKYHRTEDWGTMDDYMI